MARDLISARDWAYLPDPPPTLQDVRQLLEQYSGVCRHEVDDHLRSTRDEAWAIARYPYIGRWNFLRLLSYQDSRYRQTLFRLRLANSRDALLDVGCCVAPLLRQLRHDGVPGCKLYGIDVEPRFIDIGYSLFNDQDTIGARFIVGDMLDFDDARPRALEGKITIIHASSFFHLFSWIQQLGVGKRLVSFIDPGTSNALIYGRQMGNSKPGYAPDLQGGPFLHNETSFQKLWDEIGFVTGTRWRVMFENVRDPEPDGLHGTDRPVDFTIYQLPS